MKLRMNSSLAACLIAGCFTLSTANISQAKVKDPLNATYDIPYVIKLFGDSLTDIGNIGSITGGNIPEKGYVYGSNRKGRNKNLLGMSNGKMYPEFFKQFDHQNIWAIVGSLVATSVDGKTNDKYKTAKMNYVSAVMDRMVARDEALVNKTSGFEHLKAKMDLAVTRGKEKLLNQVIAPFRGGVENQVDAYINGKNPKLRKNYANWYSGGAYSLKKKHIGQHNMKNSFNLFWAGNNDAFKQMLETHGQKDIRDANIHKVNPSKMNNNLVLGRAASLAIRSYVEKMYKAGERNFGVYNLVQLSKTPKVNYVVARYDAAIANANKRKNKKLATALEKKKNLYLTNIDKFTNNFNRTLPLYLSKLEKEYKGLKTVVIDVNKLFQEALKNPKKFGVKNVTDSWIIDHPQFDPDVVGENRAIANYKKYKGKKLPGIDDYLFVDDVHINEVAHAQVALLTYETIKNHKHWKSRVRDFKQALLDYEKSSYAQADKHRDAIESSYQFAQRSNDRLLGQFLRKRSTFTTNASAFSFFDETSNINDQEEGSYWSKNDMNFGPQNSKFSIYMVGFNDNNISKTSNQFTDYDFQNRSLMFGADYKFDENIVAGIAFTQEKETLSSNPGNSMKNDTSFTSLYGGYKGDQSYAMLSTSFGNIDNQGLNRLSLDGLSHVKGDSDITLFTANFNTGYQFKEKNWSITPFASLEYSNIDKAGYVESGASEFRNQKVDDYNTELLTATIGFTSDYKTKTDFGDMLLQASLSYEQDLLDKDNSITIGLSDYSPATKRFDDGSFNSGKIKAGFAMTNQFDESSYASLSYEAAVEDFSEDNHTVNLTYGLSF